jgi:hypothetical protein
MKAMRRLLLLAAAWALTAATAAAQGVQPIRPIYNSMSIGSGQGGVVGGTGPLYPNGTTAPATRPAIPPGGLPPVGRIDTGPSLPPPPPTAVTTTSPYPRLVDPYSLPLSRRKIVKDPDVGKNATDRGKDDGAPPATTL